MKKYRIPQIIAGLLGMLVFCRIFGIYVIRPTYTSWLMNGNDLTQHYLGFLAYRPGKWQFPFGLTDRLAYPSSTSVIFTDSIPVFAVLFKLLSPILPAQFQYFGLWGLFCFFMQSYLAAKIVSKYTDNIVYIILSGLLFSLTPVMIWRMFRHTALAGQWLLLFMAEPLFEKRLPEEEETLKGYLTKKRGFLLRCAAAGALGVSIHLYLLLMCGILLASFCFADTVLSGKKNPGRHLAANAAALFSFLASALLAMFLLGGFSSGSGAEGEGLGSYSANLNTLINPQGWSVFLPDRELWTGNQYEGFGYPGLGVMVFLAVSVLSLLIVLVRKKDLFSFIVRHRVFLLTALLSGGISFILALSPYITWDGELKKQLELPEKVIRLWSVFRASGRLVWIPVYLLMLFAVLSAAKLLASGKKAAVLFALTLTAGCILLQALDLREILKEKNEYFNQKSFPYEKLSGDVWDSLGENETIRHLYLVSIMDKDTMYHLTDWALSHGKTVSRFYFARSMDQEIDANLEQALKEKSPEDLFLYTKEGELMRFGNGLKEYKAGDLILCYAGDLPGLTPCEAAEPVMEIRFVDGKWLENGEDQDGIRTLFASGLSYGPYFEAPKGEYEIRIAGEGLGRAEILICSKESTYFYEFETKELTDESAVIGLTLPENEADLQVAVRNLSEEPVRLTGIDVELLR